MLDYNSKKYDTTPPNGTGRLHIPDERDKKFLLTLPPKVKHEAARIESRYWITRGEAFDQGNTSQCVSYAWQRYLSTNPVVNKPLDFEPFYNECQTIDQWPGEDYDGTSVRAGASLLRDKGYGPKYQWAFDFDTALDHILTTGPMVFGTTWTWDMFFPNEKGVITPGGYAGYGHAYMVLGASRRRQQGRIINSWGAWGQKGRAWISFDHLDKLVKDNGEACMFVEQRKIT